ncbi:DNA polymerase I [Limnoraphis robusta]|uniref:DNA polymerase I n=1 Tax=Limnoraphis robusta CCNP1315 TaxID=3110306 RepID=A0ABU5U6E8_9CYAN|nr:DNA polymerase I [Limnoraphis robusta]MEA5522456.1 DNA polymerase I [Limnoraphis robusta CCNP1315]MEA5546215.1 DNA polymerase I [Limnoraphis robusta CCNP1324]
MANTPVLILVDGHSLAFRAYYAFAKSRTGGLRTQTGIPTSVSFGFLNSLLNTIKTYKPQYLAIAFDRGEPTFRHEADATYKANRSETPEDFIEDIHHLQEVLEGLNVPIVTAAGFEADDVIGTLAKQGLEAGYFVKILSGDQDLFQLIDGDEKISVLHLSPGKGNQTTEFRAENVIEKLKIKPSQLIDYKALCGDKSDNIPGVRGIGEKTAVQLLSEYPSLDEIYASLDKIKGATRQKLEDGKEAAYHSQRMATIVQDVPLKISIADCNFTRLDFSKIIPKLKELEFWSFVEQVENEQLFEEIASETEEKIANFESENSSSNQVLDDDELSFWSYEETQAVQKLSGKQFIQPKIIQTEEQLQDLVKQLEKFTDQNHPVAWDTETTALEPRDAKLVGIGCCWGSEKTDIAYIPLEHTTGTQLKKEIVLEALRPILESEKYPKALQNAKFDRLILKVQGINLAGVVFDTMLASYVLNPDESHNLTELSRKYLDSGIVAKSYKQLSLGKNQTIADLDIPTVAEYCGLDVYATYLLVPKLREKLQQVPELHKLLLEIEQPLEPVLAEMEYLGIRINVNYLKQLSSQLEKQLDIIEKRAYEEAGTEFNLGSPKQLSQLLFETLELSTKKSRKTKTGYSTDAKVLEKLKGDHPIIDSILEHRTLAKLKSTYVDALPELVHPQTKRIHTDFNQAITATGRLSSSNPNLQNIPIRTEFSRQIRQAFIPEPGWVLIAADYSQIELRILAHLSDEPILVEAYQNNRDIHTVTAQFLFEKDNPTDVTPEERRFGKTINFGVIYGMGALRFSREMKVNTNKAKEFIERFNQQYEKLFKYLEQQKKTAISQGYVTTLLGRRRYFHFESPSLKELKGSPLEHIDLDLLKSIGQNDAQLLRAAANAPIQGSSADIIKIAMVKLKDVLQNYTAKLLLQVHDELVLEVPPEEWEELQPKIKHTMENAYSLKVPLLVEIHAGENWMEAK